MGRGGMGSSCRVGREGLAEIDVSRKERRVQAKLGGVFLAK